MDLNVSENAFRDEKSEEAEVFQSCKTVQGVCSGQGSRGGHGGILADLQQQGEGGFEGRVQSSQLVCCQRSWAIKRNWRIMLFRILTVMTLTMHLKRKREI